MEVWRSSYTVEVWKFVLSCCWASSTIKDFYAMEAWRRSYIMEVWKGFLHHGSVEACTELVGCIEYHKRFLRRGSVEDCTEQVRVHRVP